MNLKALLFIAAAATGLQAGAQTWVSDSVLMGPGYANDQFYNLGQTGAVATPANNTWHLSFEMLPPGPYGSVAVRANHVTTAVKVYSLRMKASTNFATLTATDTIGKTGAQLYSMDSTWDIGAFNRNASSSIVDYGWGTYQGPPNHDVQGDSLYLVKTATETYKVWIKQYVSMPTDSIRYIFRIAKWDNSGDTTISVYRKNGFTDRLFAYYNMSTRTILDREPSRSAWDFVFTRYISEIPIGGGMVFPNASTGALSNFDANVARAAQVLPDQAVMSNFTFSDLQNVIGYDWKTFNQSTSTYTIEDSLSYFIKSKNNGFYYQLMFTGFGGSADGKIVFMKKKLGALAAVPNTTSPVEAFFVSPNPASSNASVMIDAKEGSVAEVILSDISGRMVQHFTVQVNKGMNAYTINTSALNSGLYIINVTNGSWKVAEKLVVQH